MTILSIPRQCPVCKGDVIIKQNNSTKILMCINPNCLAKIEGKILHFIGTHGLNIESMSIATIKDLINLGWITQMSDIFSLKNHREEWINIKGYGENSVDKILEAIPTSIELWKIIASAGIPNIEKQKAIVLANYFGSWKAFRNAINNKFDFTTIKGFGSSNNEALLSFDYTEIDNVMNFISIKQTISNGKLDNTSFCITGKLSIKRDDLIKLIEANGGKISSVNKNLNYLICNDKMSTSGKSKKAKDLGITIITEDEFMHLLS